VPGQVEELSVTPGLQIIKLNWEEPTLYNYCVSHYVIDWVQVENGNNDSIIVSGEKNSFVIRDLKACVEYEVSVKAMNVNGESSGAVTRYMETESNGNYQKPFCFSIDICANK
jgi:hypothetical protein